MNENEIGVWFLLLGLFFPRFTLFFWWITGNLPYNVMPLIVDVIGAIFVPRLLIMAYIYDIQGMSGWFWMHFIFLCLNAIWGMYVYSTNSKK